MNSFTLFTPFPSFTSMHFRDLKIKDSPFNKSFKEILKVKNYFVERSLLFLIAFLLVFSFSTKIYSQEKEKQKEKEKEKEKQILESIVKDWQDRFHKIKTVHYKYEISKDPGSNKPNPAPPPKVDNIIKYELFLDTKNKRAKRLSFTRNSESVTIWNGKFLHYFNKKPIRVKKDGLVDYEINRSFLYCDLNDFSNGSLTHSALDMEHGMVTFGSNRRLKFGQIETKLDTKGLKYEGKRTKDGKEYIISSPGEEIWVDLDKKSFISRYINRSGAYIFDFEIQSGQQNDFYYPKSWQLTISTAGKIESIERGKITSILVNPKFHEEDFEGPALRPNEVVRIITLSPKSSIYKGTSSYYEYKLDDQLKPVLKSKEPFKSYTPLKEEYPKERSDWLQKYKRVQ